ncbi:hypothetical protein LJR044_000116 [Microbacterium foliorum]|jgi:hypothetical protein|uniref:hypothetical protein n=1 Tax=Microbacterium TaxID=33882 RepID=UPI0005ACD394|nr:MULTISPECIES: hypothetical protein [Microbacterium]AQY00153.1 hypothetical protein B2G67_00565 [Microbacterium foliorum]KIP91120.1 hypothetical protein RU09_10610 [Microbacterium sp. MEJ108Y]
MPGSDELYPPFQYGWGWLLLAFGILLLLIAAAWLIVALTRPRRDLTLTRDAQGPTLLTTDVLSQLRVEYFDRIQRIEDDYRARALSARNANLELSRVVRTFVNEYSGLEAPVLALDDLVARGVHPALVDAMGRHYYPSIFRPGPAIDPIAGAEAARTVVRTWH